MFKRKGFTLIELLIVIAIIGLLATLAIISLTTAQRKARDTKRIADMKSIQTAVELYFSDNSSYPDPADWAALQTDLAPYISQVPVDPNNSSGTQYIYAYCTAGGPCASSDQYAVGATLEDTTHTALDQDDDLDYDDPNTLPVVGGVWDTATTAGMIVSTGAVPAALDCSGAGVYCLSE